MYVVLDIEATNGKVGEERIIEIAAYRYNGHEVVDQFVSLVNPEAEVGHQVTRLTGITNKMVRSAPKFYELAKRIVEITKDSELVGHNVGFDHRMLRQEFDRLGFDFEKECIDTLPLSQELMPNEPAYSLGKLCVNLGIPLTKRHRAAGDARATIELFKILKEKDAYKSILTQHQNPPPKKKKNRLNQHLESLMDGLPNEAGVYYMRNSEGVIFYVGKSKNIRQRIRQHFTGRDKKSRIIQDEVNEVAHERTGNELLALVKESHEIKKIQPKLNRAKRKRDDAYIYGLYVLERTDGFLALQVAKKTTRKTEPLLHFRSLRAAQEKLLTLSDRFQLCMTINTGKHLPSPCFRLGIEKCLGVCAEKEEMKSYNQRVNNFLKGIAYKQPNFLVIGKGRSESEQSFLWIRDEHVLGYGFYEYFHQIANAKKREKRLVRVDDAKDMRWTVLQYIRNGTANKIVYLSASGEVDSSPGATGSKSNETEFTQ